MRTQVVILAWLHILGNGLVFLFGHAIFFLMGGLGGAAAVAGGHAGLVALPVLGSIGAFVFLIIAIYSLPGILAGWGLLQGANWARILCIVLSIIDLFGFPFGTALGVYGLVVLFNPEVVAYFESPRYTMQ
jgi:hypothetical protein